MARRSRPKKKGLNPIVAILILLGSIGFVANSLMGSMGGKAIPDTADMGDLSDEGYDLDLEEGAEEIEIVWRDLLAVHGSYDRQTPVRLAFSVMANVTPGAAPGGETVNRWVGDEPPSLRLGVVMVSEKSRRAVLGGAVVGVGDFIGGGSVLAIEPGTLRLRWQQRDLTYDLDSEVPREFRVEHARRLLEQQELAEQEDGVVTSTDEADSAGVTALTNAQVMKGK